MLRLDHADFTWLYGSVCRSWRIYGLVETDLITCLTCHQIFWASGGVLMMQPWKPHRERFYYRSCKPSGSLPCSQSENVRLRNPAGGIWEDGSERKRYVGCEFPEYETGGDLFAIEVEENRYPTDDFGAATEITRDEIKNGDRPAMRIPLEDLDDHDVIFVSYAGGIIGLN